MGLTSQGVVPGEPVLELELHLGPELGQGQKQQWEQKDPSLCVKTREAVRASVSQNLLHSWPFLVDPL